MNPYVKVLRKYFESKSWLASDQQYSPARIQLKVAGDLSKMPYSVTIEVKKDSAQVFLDTGVTISSESDHFATASRILDPNSRTGYFWLNNSLCIYAKIQPGLSIYQIEAAVYDVVESAECLDKALRQSNLLVA